MTQQLQDDDEVATIFLVVLMDASKTSVSYKVCGGCLFAEPIGRENSGAVQDLACHPSAVLEWMSHSSTVSFDYK